MHMYVCVHVDVNVCMIIFMINSDMYAHICGYIYNCVMRVYMYVCMYTHIHMCIHILMLMCAYMYVGVCVCMLICICVCIQWAVETSRSFFVLNFENQQDEHVPDTFNENCNQNATTASRARYGNVLRNR